MHDIYEGPSALIIMRDHETDVDLRPHGSESKLK